jgi:hypothetical protein
MIQIWRRREKEVVGEVEDPDPIMDEDKNPKQ